MFGDAVFAWDYDLIADRSKARRLGFHDYVQTDTMFFDLFDELRRRRRLLPPRWREGQLAVATRPSRRSSVVAPAPPPASAPPSRRS